jgi:hypothetical protein
MHSIELCDTDALQDFGHYTANEIHDSLLFLESLFCPRWDTTLVKLQRALLVALALRRRICSMRAIGGCVSSDDKFLDGYDDIEKNNTVQRSNDIVKLICDSFGEREMFRNGVLSYDLLKTSIADWIGEGDALMVGALPCNALYSQIISKS